MIRINSMRNLPKGYSYIPILYTFGGEVEYVAYKIDLTEEQSDRLGKFCEFSVDKMYSFNPAKYFTCRCCAGCVKSLDMASQEFIVKAIEKEKAESIPISSKL